MSVLHKHFPVIETQCATTIVESYADDAVKKSAENIVKIDRDLECQKLKYLGQPCNTVSDMNKDQEEEGSLTILFGSTTCRSGNIHNFCKD
jgi:hypothetical protein